MARTIAQIYDSLNTVKANMTELQGYVTEVSGVAKDDSRNLVADVTSGSKIANWRLWLWVVAVGSWVMENLFDSAVASIAAVVNSARPHTLRWYEQETGKWQYGHELVWINDDHYGYATDDPDARLVAAVAASESDTGEVTIKAVKEVSGALTQLSTLEQESLAAYWAQWKDAGVAIEIVSRPANVLDIQATVVRDRLILDDDGYLLRDSSINPLTDSINAYMEAIPFNGVIRKTDLEAAAKQAEGIKDFVITFFWIREGDGVSWTQISREIVPSSGFATIDFEVSDFTYIDE